MSCCKRVSHGGIDVSKTQSFEPAKPKAKAETQSLLKPKLQHGGLSDYESYPPGSPYTKTLNPKLLNPILRNTRIHTRTRFSFIEAPRLPSPGKSLKA